MESATGAVESWVCPFRLRGRTLSGPGPAPGTSAENDLGPADVARGLFEAAQRKDQALLETYVPSPAAIDWATHAPSFEILYIGERFRTGRYAGVYVPYKIRFDGEIKEWQLALRNDNAERRWVLDGGIRCPTGGAGFGRADS